MSGGVGAALGEALAAHEGEGEPVQAALFEDLTPGEIGALDAPSPLSALFEPKGKAGRKPGSRNKRTEAVTAWLLAQARHPVLVMMEAYSMSPAQLAARIGLALPEVSEGVVSEVYDNATLLELYKLQLRMAETAAPYVAQRQAQAVQLKAAEGDFTLTLAGVSLPARGEAGDGAAVIEGEVMSVRLPSKSDDPSRTDG